MPATNLDLPTKKIPPISPLPPGSVIPIAANRNFTGREKELLTLAQELSGQAEDGPTAVSIISTISGMGGVGKTQLAAEFAHRYGRFFPGGVQWISLAEMKSVGGHIAAAGLRMNLASNYGSLGQPEQIALVQQAWQGPQPHLIIFDNCESDQLLDQWRPKTGHSRLLVTSRQGTWNAALGLKPLPLRILTPPASIALLQKFAPWLTTQEAQAIAHELGHLPLALHLAGSYLRDNTGVVDAATYLNDIQQAGVYQTSLADNDNLSPTQHDRHVGQTFAVSYRKIGPADEVARSILARLACLAPGEPVPPELLLALMQPEEDQTSRQALNAALRRLHRLIISYLSRQLELADIRPQVEETVGDEAEKINEAGLPAPLQQWADHLRFVAETAAAQESAAASWLLDTLGGHLQMVADYQGAKAAHEQALTIAEATFDPDHPTVAIQANNLGLVLLDLGDLAGARAAFERALAIGESTLGPNHPNVAIRLNNLGGVLKDLGELDEARAAYERAIDIDTAVFGPNHPEVATDVNNLGLVLRQLGDLDEARTALEQALAIDTAVFGPNHPSVARDVNNLGLVLQDLGELAGARAAFEQALAIDTAVFGPNHPNVATDVNNLGGVLKDLGELDEARAAYERAIDIDTAVFGPNHPEVATDVNNLGLVLRQLGDLDEARTALEQALAIDTAVFGPNHPSVARDVNNLGLVLQDLGELAGARAAFEQALAIDTAVFGPNHPNVATDVNNLGSVLHDLGDLDEARAAFEQALAIWEKRLGKDHPQVAIGTNNLGSVLQDLGELDEARASFERALAIDTAVFGPNHPKVAIRLNNLGYLLEEQGDRPAAIAALKQALKIREHFLGSDHPQTQDVKLKLASLQP